MEVIETLQANLSSLTTVFGMIVTPFLAMLNSALIRSGFLKGKFAPFIPIALGMILGMFLNVSLVGGGLLPVVLGILVGGTLGGSSTGLYEGIKKLS